MYQTDIGVKTGINSEIHASLRRLEDADYAYNEMQDEAVNTVIDQTNAATSSLQSQIDTLTNKFSQLYSDISPHMYNNDLCYFQTIYVGNLQVDSGGTIDGTVTFEGSLVTFKNNVIIDEGLDVYGDNGIFCTGITLVEDLFQTHSLSIEGTTATNKILATGDISFNLTDLASGGWVGNTSTYGVYTNNNHVELGSTTVSTTVSIVYDSNSHEYNVTAYTKDEDGIIRSSSGIKHSGTEAYEDGEDNASTSYPPNSATFEWFETVGEEAHFRRTDGDFFGRTSRTVYWD